MARNDIFVNINAISPADAFVTGQQDMTAADAPELILGDTPTFNFYFTDNTNTWPSWAGNAAYTVTWALSDAVSGDFAPAATTGNATPITGGWSIDLPLNAYDLVGLLNSKRISQAYPVTYLWQQIRVTAPTGKEVTRAMVYTPIRYRAISDTQNTESATPTGGRFVTVNNTNDLTTPTLAQFYDANPVPASALPLGLGTDTAPANGELLIGNGTGYVTSTLTAGTGVTITNGAGSITIDATGAQELLTATVKNAEAVAITKGQVVYLYSATGGFPSVKLAYNTGDATSAKTFGVVSDTSIAANGTGTITCVGVVDGLNLGGYSDGDTVYLGATAGTITATKPYAPNHLVYVGIVERANAGNGELYVKIQNGYELDEIHDVQITSAPAAGALLMRDATNSLWKANRLSAGTNIAVTNADTSVTIGLTGTIAVANGGTGVTTSTGSGSVVLSTSPSLTTPILGTPQSGTLTNCTGLPVSTGVSGLGSGVATFLATPNSANLRSAVTDETGTGALVFANTPSLVTPDIGAATGTSATLTGNANVSDVRLGGTSGPSAKSSIAARAARQGLVFDGTAGATVSGLPVANIFSLAIWARVDSFSDYRTLVYGGSNSIAIYANSAGRIVIDDGALKTSSTTITAGQLFLLTVVKASGASNYSIRLNGGSEDTSVAVGAALTAALLTHIGTGAGFNNNSGYVYPYAYNRALSAAEVVSLYESGVPAGADYIPGGASTALYTSNFTSGVDGWNVDSPNTRTAVDQNADGSGIPPSDDWLRVQRTVSTGVLGCYRAKPSVVSGTKIRLTTSIFLPSGSPITHVSIGATNGSVAAGTLAVVSLTAGATTSVDVSFTLTGSFVNIITSNSAGAEVSVVANTAFYLKTMVWSGLGLLLAPDAAQAGGGLTWYDTSGNAANITLPASGVTWNVPSSLILGGKWTVATPVDTTGMFNLLPSGGDYFALALNNRSSGAAAASRRWIIGNNWNNNGDLSFLQSTSSTSTSYNTMGTFAASGNYLLGTTIDGGQKLQVAGTALVSSDTTVGGTLYLDKTIPLLELREASVVKAQLYTASGALTLQTNTAKSITLATNGTTALTLDSSQRCILSGALRLNNAYTAGAPTATGYVTIQDSAGNTYKVLVGT